jgi:hypothetical protein
MASFKRFRKVDHSDGGWASPGTLKALEHRGMGTRPGGGSLNGFGGESAGFSAEPTSAVQRCGGSGFEEAEPPVLLRVTGPSRFHRDI